MLYIHDILLVGNDVAILKDVKTWLGTYLSMKDLGNVAYILEITIYRDGLRRIIGLNQSTYIDKVLYRFGMQNTKR